MGSRTGNSAANSSNSIGTQAIKVLHVDDDSGILSTTKQILELQHLFHVETVSTVRQAIQKLSQQRFDVIVSDYQMPEKDGLTFLKELRETGDEIPFILFTGKGREEVAIKALNIGADYYLNKLGHPETVYPQLSHYILQAVTKRKAEKRLTYKLEFESVISRISSRFVNPPDFDNAINASLEDVGQTSGASRVWLFLLNENQTAIKNIYEWCSESVAPQLENLRKLDVEEISWGIEQLRDGKTIQLPNVSLLPAELTQIKEFLENKSIKSILILPLLMSGELAGFIGLNNVHDTEFWGSDDVALIQIVLELVGNYLERKAAYEKLKENEKTYRLLAENITDVIYIQDMNLNVTYISPSIKTLSGYTPEEVYQLKPADFMTPESFERGIVDFKQALSLIAEKPDSEIPLNQFEYIRKDGTTFWGELRTKILLDFKGHPVGIQGILRDVTDRRKTEEKLKTSEEKYRLLTENISDAVFIHDLDLNITYASPSVEALTGYTPEEALNLKPEQFLAPDSFELASRNWKNAISMVDKLPDNHVRVMHYEYVRKDGSTFWGELKVKFLWDSKGRLLGTQGILRDITDRKKTEQKLKESEELYRLLTENTTDVIFIQNLDLSIRYVSPSVESLSGYTPEEIINIGPQGLMTPESYERGLVEIQTDLALAEQDPNHQPSFRCYEYICKDGSRGWGEFKPKLLRDSEGNIVAMQGTLRDVTERKKAEEALREEQKKLELVTGTLKIGLCIISKDYKILWANKFLKDLCGDVLGKTCHSIYNDLGMVCPGCGVKEIFETGKDHVVHHQSVPSHAGQRAWLEITANAIRNEKGDIIAASELSVSIDERKQMENNLRKAEKMYRFLFNKAPVGISIINLNGRIVAFNDKAYRQLGYSREEFENMSVADVEVLDTAEEQLVRIKRIQANGSESFETKHRTKTGEIRDVIVSIQFMEFDGKHFFYSITKDITEQKKAEMQLLNSEKKYREMINAMTDIVWAIDFDGNISDVNDSAINVLGYSRTELLTMQVKQIDMNVSTLEDEGICERLFAGYTQVFRSIYTTKDGRNIPVDVNASPVTYDGRRGILCIARDVTERTKAEESMDKILKELLVINEKLSVVGRLTRHDVSNKLSVISNNVYLARQKLTDKPDISQYFNAIDSAVDQVARIFSFARTYEQLGVEELSYIDVRQCVDEAISLFSGISEIKFVNDCSGLFVMADSLLRQIFYNFIDDSLKHGEKVTEIKVYFEQELDQLCLIYEDNGIGIPETEKEISFKEGYGKGTGYGLYLIRKICEAYGWTVNETGHFGDGVKFVVCVPRFNKNNEPVYKIELD